jgi:predicted Fe-S protein YdhL (DUF1289 family)
MNHSQIPSPCIGICQLLEDDSGEAICRGCLRKVSEIAGWSNKSDLEKQNILDRIQRIKENTQLERKLS